MSARQATYAILVALGPVLFAAPTVSAQPSNDPSFYFLTPSSAFETGCFGPCECPVFTRGLQGTFVLQYLGSDPLYDNYAVRDVRWSVTDTNASAGIAITGSGSYKVGGEFAVQQQMSLDLSINGTALRRFDSGLVLGGGDFPHIAIDISLHQNTACTDTVMHVDAKDPVVGGIATGSGTPTYLSDATPNPFRDQTRIQLHLGSSGPLDVMIYDVQGRAVRHLVSHTQAESGDHPLEWDGRSDQGTMCSSGVYFVGARVGAEIMVERIVKLQ